MTSKSGMAQDLTAVLDTEFVFANLTNFMK
jgi:hypothetical protein